MVRVFVAEVKVLNVVVVAVVRDELGNGPQSRAQSHTHVGKVEVEVEVEVELEITLEVEVEIMLELELDSGGSDPSQEEPRMFASTVTPLVLPPVENSKTSVPLSAGNI